MLPITSRRFRFHVWTGLFPAVQRLAGPAESVLGRNFPAAALCGLRPVVGGGPEVAVNRLIPMGFRALDRGEVPQALGDDYLTPDRLCVRMAGAERRRAVSPLPAPPCSIAAPSRHA